MNNEPPLTEDQILTHMGVLLLNVQSFEWLLLQALKLIYADTADVTAAKIYAEDKRTLGTLIKDLKTKALIEHDADALLSEVLKDRNMFAHNLRHQEWFDLSTHEGRERALDFLMPFTHNLNRAMHLFVSLHIKHGDEIGFDSPDVRQIKQDKRWQIADYYPHAAKMRKRD